MKNIKKTVLQEVIFFMIEYDGSLDFVSIDENTRIEKDLRITGDEAVEFFIAYSKRFNIDVSKFMFGDYFNGEGFDFSPILEALKLKKKSKPKKVFTVGDLIKGIEAGRLDEEVLNSPQIS